MTAHPDMPDRDLHGLLDGELDPARAAEIAQQVAADPAVSQRLADFRADKARLTALYAPLAREALPAAWLRTIEEQTASPQRRPEWRAIGAVAAVLLLLVGGWLGYARLAMPAEDPIIAQAVAARDEQLAPDHIFDQTLLTATAGSRLLTTALALPLKVPDLSKLGFHLAGLETYAGARGETAELTYRDAGNRVFTLYLARSAGAARFDLLKRGPLRLCLWQDEELGAVMAGEMSAGEMLRLASLAYTGLSL